MPPQPENPLHSWRLSDFKLGWFIGDFVPSVIRTPDFEVALKHHRMGEVYEAHYQKTALEFNLVVQGRVCIGAQCFNDGDIFLVPPGRVTQPVFVTDCTIVCIKVPSLPHDKEVVDVGHHALGG